KTSCPGHTAKLGWIAGGRHEFVSTDILRQGKRAGIDNETPALSIVTHDGCKHGRSDVVETAVSAGGEEELPAWLRPVQQGEARRNERPNHLPPGNFQAGSAPFGSLLRRSFSRSPRCSPTTFATYCTA